jgi:hypothetical protein
VIPARNTQDEEILRRLLEDAAGPPPAALPLAPVAARACRLRTARRVATAGGLAAAAITVAGVGAALHAGGRQVAIPGAGGHGDGGVASVPVWPVLVVAVAVLLAPLLGRLAPRSGPDAAGGSPAAAGLGLVGVALAAHALGTALDGFRTLAGDAPDALFPWHGLAGALAELGAAGVLLLGGSLALARTTAPGRPLAERTGELVRAACGWGLLLDGAYLAAREVVRYFVLTTSPATVTSRTPAITVAQLPSVVPTGPPVAALVLLGLAALGALVLLGHAGGLAGIVHAAARAVWLAVGVTAAAAAVAGAGTAWAVAGLRTSALLPLPGEPVHTLAVRPTSRYPVTGELVIRSLTGDDRARSATDVLLHSGWTLATLGALVVAWAATALVSGSAVVGALRTAAFLAAFTTVTSAVLLVRFPWLEGPATGGLTPAGRLAPLPGGPEALPWLCLLGPAVAAWAWSAAARRARPRPSASPSAPGIAAGDDRAVPVLDEPAGDGDRRG